MKTTDKPLIIVDSSCALHKIIDFQLRGAEKKVIKITNKKRDAVIKAGINYFKTGFSIANIDPSNADIVFSGDDKTVPYWRFEYVKKWLNGLDENKRNGLGKELLKGYKGTRNNCQFRLHCQNQFFKYSKSVLMPGYESDDIIAAIVKAVDGKRPLIILTVDSDLSGLISDQKNVIWVCLTGYNPPVRDEQRLKGWITNKLEKETVKNKEILTSAGIDLSNPKTSDLWLWKRCVGDKSDNLAPGTPRELIDLFEPPLEHRLWENEEFLKTWESHIQPCLFGEEADVSEEIWMENYWDKKLANPVYLPKQFTGKGA